MRIKQGTAAILKRSSWHARPRDVTSASAFSRHMTRAPETAKFVRKAAPAFFRGLSKEYSRDSLRPRISGTEALALSRPSCCLAGS